ncbi:MAG: IS91 family transposase, partial [Geminicoccaceae bacterium]
LETCDHCDSMVARYHSCRDRHCPKCQTMTKERWIEARNAELLTVPHYHLVFTLPHALNPLIQGNPRCLYDLLFKAASETLLTFGRDRRWIGGELGITLVLHTWSQNLGQHVHVHGLVTGGGLAPDGNQWKSSKKRFLFPVKALSKVFQAKYLELLAHAARQGKLRFGGSTLSLADHRAFAAFIADLKGSDWVVYAKAPFSGPRQVVAYLGRYTHKAAISNERILSLENGQVRFRWRDYRDGSMIKIMQLDATEFIRRFLLHVLPSGFMRIRHYGLFANRHRKTKLAHCRALLHQPEPELRSKETTEAMVERLTGHDITKCTICGRGHMKTVMKLRPIRPTWSTGPPRS